MDLMLLGAVAMAYFITGLFFLRFWKMTGDRFFLCFALSFFIDDIGESLIGVLHYSEEEEPLLYILRLASFMIILYAIADKNRRQSAEKIVSPAE